MNKEAILITCIGGTLSIDNVIGLKNDSNLNLEIIGVDAKNINVNKSILDFFYVVPDGKSKQYLPKVLEICETHKIKLIIPGSDEEALVLSKAKDKLLSKGIKISCCSEQTIKIITNKSETYSFLKKKNIKTPSYDTLTCNDDLYGYLKFIKRSNQSYVLKKNNTRGGRGIFFLENISDPIPDTLKSGRETVVDLLQINSSQFKNLVGNECIIMKLLLPKAFDVDVFAENGKVREFLIRERVNPTGIPFRGSILREDNQIEELIKSVCSILNISGLVDFDLMLDKNNEIQLLEINPRMSGSISACYAFDFPILSKVIASLLGIEYPKLQTKKVNFEVYIGVKKLII